MATRRAERDPTCGDAAEALAEFAELPLDNGPRQFEPVTLQFDFYDCFHGMCRSVGAAAQGQTVPSSWGSGRTPAAIGPPPPPRNGGGSAGPPPGQPPTAAFARGN